MLTKEPKHLLNDNNAGKPQGIRLMIGRRPQAPSVIRRATAKCWNTLRRETAPVWRCWYCTTTHSASTPTGLPKAYLIPRSARFTQELCEEAKKTGCTVISIKNDWKQLFPSSIGRAIK